jgi:hypothetical protein
VGVHEHGDNHFASFESKEFFEQLNTENCSRLCTLEFITS